MMSSPQNRTPLYDQHVQLKAQMGEFAGYQMPLWYPEGVRKEQLAVVTAAGVFDTSHMSVLTLGGAGAFDLLQSCFSRDLSIGRQGSASIAGSCFYGVFLNHDGTVIDDAIVYGMGDATFVIVVNAGMGSVVAAHLTKHADAAGQVTVDMHTGRVAKLDIQGPASAIVLSALLGQRADVFLTFPYFSFKGRLPSGSPADSDIRLTDGTPVMISRTGYTGEFGFELFLPSEAVADVWNRILRGSNGAAVQPCGLAARDALRTGAVLPLSHQDIGPWPFIRHPWPFALPYDSSRAGFTKDFVGGKALLTAKDIAYTQPFAGFDLRKITTDQARVIDADDQEVGMVTTCVTDMTIGRHEGRIHRAASPDIPDGFVPKGLCCGFVRVQKPMRPGTLVFLTDTRRKIKVEIVQDIRPGRTARCPARKMLL